MEHANKRFNHAEELLLKQMKGSKLLTIDAVLAAPPDNSWNTVRLHFEGFDIDVNNFLNNIVVDEFGTLEEFGLLSVVESSEEMLSIPEVGADTTTFEVNETIVAVPLSTTLQISMAKAPWSQSLSIHRPSPSIRIRASSCSTRRSGSPK